MVADEAHFEYADDGIARHQSWLGDFPNLIVTRTFSRPMGWRPCELVTGLSGCGRSAQPCASAVGVDSFAQAAALAALADRDHLQRLGGTQPARYAAIGRRRAANRLQFIPSAGNCTISVDLGRRADQPITRPALLQLRPRRSPCGEHWPGIGKRAFPAGAGAGAVSTSIGTLAVIGVGLIGGSLARALRAAGKVNQIVGCGRGKANLDEAVALGVIDHPAHDIAEAVPRCRCRVSVGCWGDARPFAAMRDSLPERRR